jgi:Inward rectifier potassium channel transmembrane domain
MSDLQLTMTMSLRDAVARAQISNELAERVPATDSSNGELDFNSNCTWERGMMEYDETSFILSTCTQPSSTEPPADYSNGVQLEIAVEHRRRLIEKGGECNVTVIGVRKWKCPSDIFTYLVEMPWYIHVILSVMQFILTWCLFGGIYYATAIIYGDVGQVNNASVVSCIAHVTDFASALMFSVETQATIGYGVRVVDPT